MVPPAGSPTRGVCPRCGSSLSVGGVGSETALCGPCLLLAGLEEGVPPPETVLLWPSDPGRPSTAGAGSREPGGPDQPGLQLGNHLIIRELDHGSMGTIYEARQPGTGRPVALKTILRVLLNDPDVRSRFARETQTSASLDHPYVLPIYEVGQDNGRPFYTMKLAEGGNLLKVLPRYAGRPREAVALMVKITRGVAHAHARGVLHRDLKPGNILLEADGETPLVSDFGLARWLDQDSSLTQSMVVFGTPGYMAPEQARQAGAAGPAADVYSLGAMLFQLLCGRTPFRGQNALDVVTQAAAGPTPALRTFNPKAARDLETICARCLEIKPERRPKCAADLADDLERWLAGRPIRLRPVRFPERARRWTARNPWLAAAGAGCLLLGTVAGLGHGQSRRLEKAMREEAWAKATVAMLPLEDIARVGDASPLAVALDTAVVQRLRAEAGIHLVRVPMLPGEDASLPSGWQRAGQATRAPAVLSGSVRRRAGNTDHPPGLRVVLRVTASENSKILARKVFDVPETRAPAAVADAVAAWVQEIGGGGAGWLTLPPPPAASRVPAAGDFLRAGQERLLRNTSDGVRESLPLFQQAIELDPDCAPAHAWLASARGALGWIEPHAGWKPKTRQAAESALRLDPWLAEAHRALGVVCLQESRMNDAVEEVLTAYELDPTTDRNTNLLGWLYRSLGQPLAAARWFERSERRETRPGVTAGHVGDLRCELGDDAGAEAAYQRFYRLRPGDPTGQINLCRLWVLQGKADRARQSCRTLAAAHPANREVRMMAAAVEFLDRRFPAAEALYRDLVATDRSGGENFPGGFGHLCVFGFLQQRGGLREEGQLLLREARQQAVDRLGRSPDDPQAHHALAAACAAAGDPAAALDALEHALASGWRDRRTLQLDPRFDALAADPRLGQLLARLDAPPAP